MTGRLSNDRGDLTILTHCDGVHLWEGLWSEKTIWYH